MESDILLILLFNSVNVSLSTSDKLESRLVTPVGSYTVSNMESNQMVKCHQTKLLEEEMILSTPSLVKPELVNTFPGLYSLILNQL